MEAPDSAVTVSRFRFMRNWRIPPSATLGLLLVTTTVFIVQLLGGSSEWQWAAGLVPANVSDIVSVGRIGEGQSIPAWLTLLSYVFLHGGYFHFLTNMVSLWMFGILAEPELGSKRFALTYIAFGVITGLAIVAIIPHWTNPMVGASGSISGILGTFLAVRFSPRIGLGFRKGMTFLLEALSLVAVVAWYVTRHFPSEPDVASSIVWHLVPFLLAWYCVRIWKGLGGRF